MCGNFSYHEQLTDSMYLYLISLQLVRFLVESLGGWVKGKEKYIIWACQKWKPKQSEREDMPLEQRVTLSVFATVEL